MFSLLMISTKFLRMATVMCSVKVHCSGSIWIQAPTLLWRASFGGPRRRLEYSNKEDLYLQTNTISSHVLSSHSYGFNFLAFGGRLIESLVERETKSCHCTIRLENGGRLAPDLHNTKEARSTCYGRSKRRQGFFKRSTQYLKAGRSVTCGIDVFW